MAVGQYLNRTVNTGELRGRRGFPEIPGSSVTSRPSMTLSVQRITGGTPMPLTRARQAIDLRAPAALAAGDRLRWRGELAEVLDIVSLSASYQQVVLRLVGRPHTRPVSLPATDLADAERIN
jgi:hypothetical protein